MSRKRGFGINVLIVSQATRGKTSRVASMSHMERTRDSALTPKNVSTCEREKKKHENKKRGHKRGEDWKWVKRMGKEEGKYHVLRRSDIQSNAPQQILKHKSTSHHDEHDEPKEPKFSHRHCLRKITNSVNFIHNFLFLFSLHTQMRAYICIHTHTHITQLAGRNISLVENMNVDLEARNIRVSVIFLGG